MNAKCTYNGNIVNIIKICPSGISGYLDITYIDSSDNIVHERVEYASTMATSVTEIEGLLT